MGELLQEIDLEQPRLLRVSGYQLPHIRVFLPQPPVRSLDVVFFTKSTYS